MLKSVLFFQSVLEYWLSKQQVTSDQIGSDSSHGYASCHSNGGCVRSGVGWLVLMLVFPITQKICNKLRWQQCLPWTCPSWFECSKSQCKNTFKAPYDMIQLSKQVVFGKPQQSTSSGFPKLGPGTPMGARFGLCPPSTTQLIQITN